LWFINGSIWKMSTVRRAWVFQERTLSTRVLSYCVRDIMWQCRSETNWEFPRPDSLADAGALYILPSKEVGLTWETIAQEYSRRHLTYPTDKLPALSALACEYATRTGDRYCAGMWESNLLESLAWSAPSVPRPRHAKSTSGLDPRDSKTQLNACYIAPSWS